jgi:hypothetical protein
MISVISKDYEKVQDFENRPTNSKLILFHGAYGHENVKKDLVLLCSATYFFISCCILFKYEMEA